MPSDRYACRLTEGAEPLPGGRIHATEQWVVEHCTGPLGAGTFIVKPFRHCLAVGDLTTAEAREIGPLLQRASQAVQAFPRRSRSMSVRGRMADGSRCTCISSSSRRGIAGARNMTVPDPPCRRRCFRLAMPRRSRKSRRSAAT